MAHPQASSPWSSWFGWFGRSQPAALPSQPAAAPSRPVKHAHLTESSDDDNSVSSQEGQGALSLLRTGGEATGDLISPASQDRSAPPKAAGGRKILASWAPTITPAQKKAEIVWLDDESYPPLPPPTSEPLPYDPTLLLTPPHAPLSKAPSPLSSKRATATMLGSGRKESPLSSRRGTATNILAVSSGGKESPRSSGRKSTTMPAAGGGEKESPLSSKRGTTTNMLATGSGGKESPLGSKRGSTTMPAVSSGGKDGSSVGRNGSSKVLMPELQGAPPQSPPSLSVSEASFAFPGGLHASRASIPSPKPMSTPHNPIPTTHQDGALASLSPHNIAQAEGARTSSTTAAASAPTLTPVPPSVPTTVRPAAGGVSSSVVDTAAQPHTDPSPANAPSAAKGTLLFAASSFATAAPNTQGKWGSPKWAWNEGSRGELSPSSQAHPPHTPSPPPTDANSSSGSSQPHTTQQAHNTQHSPFGSGRTSAHLQQRSATSGGALGGGLGGDFISPVSFDGGLVGPEAANVDLRDVSGREAWASKDFYRPRPHSSGSRTGGGGSKRLSRRLKRGSRSNSSSSSGSSGGKGRATQEARGRAEQNVQGAGAGNSMGAATDSSAPMMPGRQSAELGHGAHASSTIGSGMGSKNARSRSTNGSAAQAGSKDGSTSNFSNVPGSGSYLSSGAGSLKEHGRSSSDGAIVLAKRKAVFQTKHRTSRLSDPGMQLYPSTPLLGNSFNTGDVLAPDRDQGIDTKSAASSASQSGLLLPEGSGSYGAGVFVVGDANGKGTREVQPSSSGSFDRNKGGGWSLGAQDSSMGKHSDEMQRSSGTKRSVTFRGSSEDGSPHNLLPGATGFATAQGNGLVGAKPGGMESTAAQRESPPQTSLQSNRLSFPSRLARVTQRLMPMLRRGGGEDHEDQLEDEGRDVLGDMDLENATMNNHGMSQRTGSTLFGGVLGVLRTGSTSMQAAKPTNWAHRAKLLMKNQNGDLSHHLSENGSSGEDTSPPDSKGGNSGKGGRANRIFWRVASSLGKSFTSSKARGKLEGDSDDSDSQGGDSPKLGNSRPQMLPYSSFNDASNRALLASARKGDLNGVKEALQQNADPNLEDYLVTPEATNMGMTPLHYVAACGRQHTWEPPTCSDSVAATITRLLLQYGARKHPKDRMGFLPLHLAAYHGSMGVLKQLLEGVETKSDILGCSINCQDYQVRYTPLHCAVEGQQPEAVVVLLLKGASCTIKDYTSFTPWNLAATHMSGFAFSLITQLNIALAQDSRLPADAVMRLALEMRYLEAVPVVLRATAKSPQQVWALMRTAIASGLQEFAELLAEDIPTVCPRALLQVPWGDVMVELATRFPECFKILIHGLDYVDFESIVVPFIQGLNFDADPVTQEVPDAPALPSSEPQKSPPNSRPNIAKLLSNKSARGSKLNRVKPETDSPTTLSPGMNSNVYAVGGGLDSLRSNTMDRSFSNIDPQQLKVGCGKRLWSTLICRAGDEDLDDGFEEPDPAEDKKGIMSVLTRSSKTAVPDKLPSSKATSLWQRAAAASTAASEQKPRLGIQGRAKSAMSLKSMLVLGNQDEFRNGSTSGPSTRGPLPEALKYLLLRCLVSSLDKLSWKVWRALVGGLHGGLALEIAHFPKLFKRLAESIAERSVPDWREVAESDRIKQLQKEENGDVTSDSLSEHRQNDDFSAKFEQHMTLNLNHLVSAAIASRSGLNVYNIVMAMDRWLALNPTCYLGRLDPWVMGAMAAHYPDACRLLLSMEFQDQCAIKVPGHLVGSSAAPVFRCSLISQAFVWQEDGLVVLAQAGLDLKRVERWVIHGISFYAILKLFKASAYRYPSAITASFLEKLLEAGLPGQDITKLIQLDTDLNDVVAALRGGLSAHFIHHMVSRRISFQVVTEMLGATLDKSTEWMNVRHQPVWKKFPRETWRYGITYTFIRIFFETWEDYRFDKRFIDLMFDFHDPLFVKLRTALEYVNSNKALQVSLSQEKADISLARRTRLFGSVAVVCQAFKEQRIYVHRIVIAWMATLITYVYLWAVEDFKPTIKAAQQANLQGIEPKQKEGATQKLTDASELDTPFDKQDASRNMLRNGGLTESPKVDAISETLPMIDVAKTGRECYLRALLAADAPASMFGLPVVKGIINVKWISYGWRYMVLLLAEHLLFMALVITYLVLIINENQVCADHYEGDGRALRAQGSHEAEFTVDPASQHDAEARFQPGTIISLQELASCSTGIATLVLDALMSWMCALGGMSYVSQLRRCGFVLWILQADNWSDILTITLNAAILGCHLGRKHVSLLSLVSVQVLLQFMRLGSYAMMIERLGSLVRIIGQIFRDTLYFLFLLLMLYVGFALAFFVLAPPSTPPGSLALKLFTIMLGDITASFFEDEVLEDFATPWLSVLLMIAYTIMLLIVLFNMLVAIMNDTFNRIRTAEHDEVLRGKAVQLVGIEASLSSEQLESLSRLLLGKFLHVLRPTRLDKDGSGNNGAGGAGKGASDTAIAVRDAVRDETTAIREEVRQMLAAFGQHQSHKQPWSSHSPPINSASRMGTRAHSRAVSKAPSRAVSRPTSAFHRHGAHIQPKPAIKQPHLSAQAVGSNKGSKSSGPFLAPGDSAYPSRAPSEMASRAASIPASRMSSARTSLDMTSHPPPTSGNQVLPAPLSSQSLGQWSDPHSPDIARSRGMATQAGSRPMGASVSLHRDRHPAQLVRPKSSFRDSSSFREPPSLVKAISAFSGAGAVSKHGRPPDAGSFTIPFEQAAPAAAGAGGEKTTFPLTAARRAAQARHAAQINPESLAQAPPLHVPPRQSSFHEAAFQAVHSQKQRRGSIGSRFEPRPAVDKEGEGRVRSRSGSSAQGGPDMDGFPPSQEAGPDLGRVKSQEAGTSVQGGPDLSGMPSHEAGRSKNSSSSSSSSSTVNQGATEAADDAESSSGGAGGLHQQKGYNQEGATDAAGTAKSSSQRAKKLHQHGGDNEEGATDAAGTAESSGNRTEGLHLQGGNNQEGAAGYASLAQQQGLPEQVPAAAGHAGTEQAPADSGHAESKPASGEAHTPSTQAQGTKCPTHGVEPTTLGKGAQNTEGSTQDSSEPVNEPATEGAHTLPHTLSRTLPHTLPHTSVGATQAEVLQHGADAGASANTPAGAADAGTADGEPQKENGEASATTSQALSRPAAPRGPAVRFRSMVKRQSSSDDGSGDDGGEEAAPQPQLQPQHAHKGAKRVSLGGHADATWGTGVTFQPSRLASRAASRQASRPGSATRVVGFKAPHEPGGADSDRRVSDADSWRVGSLNSSHQMSREQEAVIPMRERAGLLPGGLGVHFSGELHGNACFGDEDETDGGSGGVSFGPGVVMQGNDLYQDGADQDVVRGGLDEDDDEVEIDEDYGESEEEEEEEGEEEDQGRSSGSSSSGSSSSSSLVEDDRHTLASHSILTSRVHSVSNQAGSHSHRHPAHPLPQTASRRPFSSAASSARASHTKGYPHSHQRHNPHDHPFPKVFSRAPSPPPGAAGSHGSGRSSAFNRPRQNQVLRSRDQPSSEAAASVAAAMARINDRRRSTVAAGLGLLTPAEALRAAHGDPDSDEASFLDDLEVGHRAPAPAGAPSRRQTFSQGIPSRRQTASHGFGGHTPRQRRRGSTHADAAARLTVQEGSDEEEEGEGAAVDQPAAPAAHHPTSFQASRRMRPSGGVPAFGSHPGEANPMGPSRRPSSSHMRGVPEAVSHQPVSLKAVRRSSSGAPQRHCVHKRTSHASGLGSLSLRVAVRAVEEEGGGSDADSLDSDNADAPPIKPLKLAGIRESMGSIRDREPGLPILEEESQPQLVQQPSNCRASRPGIPDSFSRRVTLDELERESRRGSGRLFQEGLRASGASFQSLQSLEGTLHESEEEEEDAAIAKRRQGRRRSRGPKVDAEIRAAAEVVVEKAMALSEAALSSRGPGVPSVLQQQQKQRQLAPAAAVVARPQRGHGSKGLIQVKQQQAISAHGLGHYPTFMDEGRRSMGSERGNSSRQNTPGNLSGFNTSTNNPTLPLNILEEDAPAVPDEGAPIDVFQDLQEPRKDASASFNTSGNLSSSFIPTNPVNSLRNSLSPVRMPSRSSRNSRNSRNSRPSATATSATVLFGGDSYNSRSSRPSALTAPAAAVVGDTLGGMSSADQQESGDNGAAQYLSFESSPSSRALRAMAAASPQGGRLAYSRKRALQAPTLLTAPVPEENAVQEGGHEADASDSGSQD